MTRDEAKQLLPILKAYSEGKTIQQVTDNGFADMVDECFFISSAENYRIKLEPTYRPFKNGEECWNEMMKHQPFGWVINKEYNTKHLVTKVEPHGTVIISYEDNRSRRGAFDDFTFADGTPFGIKEEEE